MPIMPMMPIGASGGCAGGAEPGILVDRQRHPGAGHGGRVIAAEAGSAPSQQQREVGHLGNRVLLGAIAGIVGTAAMTTAMRALHRRLDPSERYPLPPREIIERVLPERVIEQTRRTSTIASHFGYGAGVGALFALSPLDKGMLAGSAYGVLVWAGSYLGWIPSAGILKNAAQHPLRRNLLMSAVHLVWGGVTALTLRELERAEAEIFAQGKPRDAPSADWGGGPEHRDMPTHFAADQPMDRS